MAEITQIWATNYWGGEVYGGSEYKWVDTSKNMSMKAGYKFAEKNWVLCLKFVLPTDAKSFTLHFHNDTELPGMDATMRYKITTSEDSSLVNATASTAGDGTFIIKNGPYDQNPVTVTRDLSAGIYYMYIWTDKTVGYPNNWMNIRWYKNVPNAYGFYATYVEPKTGYVPEFYQKQFKDGDVTKDWIIVKENNNMVAGYSQKHNWVSVFRFELEKSIKQFTFSFCLNENETIGNPASIRYKIVTTEESSLENANVNTDADGTFTVDTRADYTRVSFTIDKYIPRGTVYLYLWTNKSVGTDNAIGIRGILPDDHYGVTGFYREGGHVIYIDNGTSFDAYEIWIDNGTKWEQYQVFIDNGSSWDECG